jgi:TATA-binding protein-associated factor Taf7
VSPKQPDGLETIVTDDATLYGKLKAKFRKPKLSRKQALSARPVRNPALKWEKLDGGEVRIILPRRDDHTGKVLSFLFYVPKSRPVTLDIVGARVWELCDGEHTVDDLVEELVEEHRLHRREAEVSLTEFLKMLGKRNMVAFIVPKEFVDGPDEGKKPPEPTMSKKPPPNQRPRRGKGGKR